MQNKGTVTVPLGMWENLQNDLAWARIDQDQRLGCIESHYAKRTFFQDGDKIEVIANEEFVKLLDQEKKARLFDQERNDAIFSTLDEKIGELTREKEDWHSSSSKYYGYYSFALAIGVATNICWLIWEFIVR